MVWRRRWRIHGRRIRRMTWGITGKQQWLINPVEITKRRYYKKKIKTQDWKKKTQLGKEEKTYGFGLREWLRCVWKEPFSRRVAISTLESPILDYSWRDMHIPETGTVTATVTVTAGQWRGNGQRRAHKTATINAKDPSNERQRGRSTRERKKKKKGKKVWRQ